MTLLELTNRLRGVPLLAPVFRQLRAYRLRGTQRQFARNELPEDISIELTNVCNLRCAKCPTYEVDRRRGFMERGLFEKLLSDIWSSRGRTKLSLSGGGEAILHPEIVEFVAAAKSVPNVEEVGLATNALALNRGLSERLLRAGLDRLKVSLDTADLTGSTTAWAATTRWCGT